MPQVARMQISIGVRIMSNNAGLSSDSAREQRLRTALAQGAPRPIRAVPPPAPVPFQRDCSDAAHARAAVARVVGQLGRNCLAPTAAREQTFRDRRFVREADASSSSPMEQAN